MDIGGRRRQSSFSPTRTFLITTTTIILLYLKSNTTTAVSLLRNRVSLSLSLRGGALGGVVNVGDSYRSRRSIGRTRLFPFGTIITERMISSDNLQDAAAYSNNIEDDGAVKIPKSFRGVFVGSGSDGMSDPRIAKTIMDLVPNNTSSSSSTSTSPVHVVYLGTATYDLPQFATRQTKCFKDLGCHVEMLNLAHRRQNDLSSSTTDTKEEDDVANNTNKNLTEYARQVLGRADIIVVGGGNTLYAIDRWKDLDVDKFLEDAMNRGAVLTGGSAGAICWFDGGHSDSCDPNSFYTSMMKKFGTDASADNGNVDDNNDGGGKDLPPPDESAIDDDDDDGNDPANKDWKYIRIPCLGFIPGLCCPHHDRVQSNGVLRADDFDEMLLRNYNTQHPSNELGIAIDHWAALVCRGEDDSYQVISLDGKKGSVLYDNEEGGDGDETDATSVASTATFSRDADGVPGIWLKEVQDGEVTRQLLPESGKLSQILRRPRKPSSTIEIDKDAIEECRRLNQPL